jgi:hypothetical protein
MLAYLAAPCQAQAGVEKTPMRLERLNLYYSKARPCKEPNKLYS